MRSPSITSKWVIFLPMEVVDLLSVAILLVGLSRLEVGEMR